MYETLQNPQLRDPMTTPPKPTPTAPAPPRLTVICGPMFAGKTTELIRRLTRHAEAGRSIIALKPRLDDRYHPTDLATHDQRTHPALAIDAPADLLDHSADVVALDEAHFFTTGLHDAVMQLLARNSDVILAGLDRTSMNEPFGEMARLLIEADEIIKRTAPCAICGREAVHTIRLFDSTEDIVVGGPGMFENRCRSHLKSK